MENDYCSYGLSLALKKCGFDWPCRCCYIADKDTESNAEFTEYASRVRWNSAKTGGSKYPYVHISAPTLTIAQKWLREAKEIDVLVWNCACGYGWEISKADAQSRGTTLMDYDDNGEDMDSGMWLTYENALYAGIVVALQFIDN